MGARLFTIRQDVNAGQWDACVKSLGGSIHHSTVFAQYVTAADANTLPCYMSLNDGDGSTAGLALGFRSRSPRSLLGRLTGRFWLEALPVVRPAGEEVLLEFVSNSQSAARRCGCTILEVNSAASRSGRE